MKNRFRRLLRQLPTVSLAAAFLFVCAGAARAQGAGSRTQGPASGPVITLPPGHGDTSVERSEPAERRKESSAAARGRRTKWEYCVIEHVATVRVDSFTSTGAAYVRYFRGGREKVDGAHEDEALANAINKLGDEGWEMFAIRDVVNIVEGAGGHSTPRYFFKRPL